MIEYTNERLGFLAETYDGPRIVKDLAAALLAERKAREVEVGELHRALGLASVAIDAAYMQSDAEWRGYDNIAGKHDKIVREGRSAIRQALKGQRDE